jgi:hypothetical protein
MLQSMHPAGTDATASEPFQAPLFNDVIARLDADQRHVVFDLGAASTPLLSVLGQARCRVEIVDLAHFGGVDRINSAESSEDRMRIAESLMPRKFSDAPINLVFCWDLPDYLSPESLSAVMTAISQRAAPGAIAHSITAYSEREMSEQPGRYVPATDGTLVNRTPLGKLVPAPRHSPEDLANNMGQFVIDRARLLSNGMQEFLFRA